MNDDYEQLRIALHDLFYAVFEAIGVGWLVRKLKLEPKDWYKQAAIRAEWRKQK